MSGSSFVQAGEMASTWTAVQPGCPSWCCQPSGELAGPAVRLPTVSTVMFHCSRAWAAGMRYDPASRSQPPFATCGRIPLPQPAEEAEDA